MKICDHCGAACQTKEVDFNLLPVMFSEHHRGDLCNKCLDELNKIIKSFLVRYAHKVDSCDKTSNCNAN